MNYVLQTASSQVVASPSNTVIGFGIAVAIAFGAVFWTGIHLREKTHTRLVSTVNIAGAGLTELTIGALRALQAEFAALMPESGGTSYPENIFADSTKIEKYAKKGIQILKQRNRLPMQFKSIITVCRILGYISVTTTVGIWISLLTYSVLFEYSMVWQSFLMITSLSFLVGIFFLAKYVLLNSKIQSSIELASSVASN